MKTENQTTLSFWQGLFYPLNIIKSNVIIFNQVTICFALLMLFITSLLSSFNCNNTYISSTYCIIPPLLTIISALFLISTYLKRVLKITTSNISLKDALTSKITSIDLKIFALIFSNTLSFIGIFLSLQFLINRKASPNFMFELGCFILFSLIIIVLSLYLLNNYLAYGFIKNQKFPPFGKIFWHTLDNLYKFLLWFFTSFTIFSLPLLKVIYLISNYTQTNNPIALFLSKFALAYIVLFIFSYWFLQLQYQEKHLPTND